ncbi:aldo/keto reductase, partial [Klebsiella pneumoniae]|uniref:aldo/keto reductase n=1 Tax=Klebsiella pneumoniae TaxID=573 RepID=UPI00210DA153
MLNHRLDEFAAVTLRAMVSFIEQHLDLGVTTVDHADIYGDYQCEAAFGEALKRAPHLRSRMEIVSKCGILLKEEMGEILAKVDEPLN